MDKLNTSDQEMLTVLVKGEKMRVKAQFLKDYEDTALEAMLSGRH